MTDLTFTLLRVGFLILLWVFVLSAIGVLRRDVAGRTGRRGKKRSGSAPPIAVSGAGPTPPIAAPGNAAPPQASATPTMAPSAAAAPAPYGGAPMSAPTPVRRQSTRATGPSRLMVTAGSLAGTALPLTGAVILIGRAANCTLVLDDDYSSSRHARIFQQNGSWYVEDLGSTNGTFVGDQRIHGTVPIALNQPVRVGRTIMELQR